MSKLLSPKKDFVYIDFEFCNSNEKILTLTSCSYKVNSQKTRSVWLKYHNKNQKTLSYILNKLGKTHIFVAYGAVAECRSFQALGLNPQNYDWVDLFYEHRQLTHTCHKFKYGNYYTATGMKRCSVPPTFDKEVNKKLDNNAIGLGYVDAVGFHLGRYIDSVHKREMRDLILLDKPKYTKAECTSIMRYCDEDVIYLPELHKKMSEGVGYCIHATKEKVLEYQINKGKWASSIANQEMEGTPIRVDWVKNLRRNFETVKDTLIKDMNKIYPFFVREKSRKRDLIGTWKFKADRFKKFVTECKHIDEETSLKIKDEYLWPRNEILKKWPLSPSGKYKTDEKTLEKFDGIRDDNDNRVIYELRQCVKTIGQLKAYQLPKEGKEDFFDSVGSDNRSRPYLGGYGTLTGRNAAKAKQFIMAQASWLRCLIQPEEGEEIVAIDYASQEFMIAAVLSNDPNMRNAYDSGDPYLAFSVYGNAVSHNDAEWWKDQKKKFARVKGYVCLDIDKYKKISAIRDLFKATVLGLQYGMGVIALAAKLSADCGRIVSIEEAQRLSDLHKKVFKVYWKWIENNILKSYKRNGFLTLSDGWSLLANQDNDLSTKNFPTQGIGAVIVKIAVRLYQEKGGRAIASLHDAVYAIFNTKTESHHPELLSQCMQKAVEKVLGKITIRQDREIHDHKHVWVEKKGKKYYDLLNKYLEHLDTPEDRIDKLKSTLYSNVY